MTIQEILRTKGKVIYSISPEATLGDVVDKLVENNCGSLLVCEQDELVGIITERDILRACAGRAGSLDELSVAEFMTREVVTGTINSTIGDIMGVLTEKRIRHLPILENGRLVGIISIGDVVKRQHDQLAMENHYLKNYIQDGAGAAKPAH